VGHSRCVQIYGKEQLFDAERVVDLLQALETFAIASTSAQGSLLPAGGASSAARCATASLRRTVQQSIQLLFCWVRGCCCGK